MKYYSLILIFLLSAYSTFLYAQLTTYAIIGDFGTGGNDETVVADLVKSWSPQFIITTGDNRYGGHNFDQTVGNDYCEFLAGAESGSNCDGNGSALNAFFPSTGNHDFTDGGGINEYLGYFDLPGTGIQSSGTSGSELYYDFVRGPVHFFVIDSYDALVNGSMTAQQTWFQEQVEASDARWKIVYFHHPPYTSCSAHSSTLPMRWSFAQWGIDAVISGHAHTYERLNYDTIPYFINGLGGATIHGFSNPLPGSIVRYNADYGAQIVVADDTSMIFSFINIHGITIDEHAIHKALPLNNAPVFSSDTILETSANEDSTYQNSIAEYASDPDGDSLNYSIISGPAWLSMAPNGDLSGTPINDDVGLNSWTIEVDDGLLGSDTALLQIIVLIGNQNPVSTGYSILEHATSEDDSEYLFMVYPNPSSGKFVLEIHNALEQRYNIEIIDPTGKVVWNNQLEKPGLHVEESIDLSGYPAALYFVKVYNENFISVKKLILYK